MRLELILWQKAENETPALSHTMTSRDVLPEKTYAFLDSPTEIFIFKEKAFLAYRVGWQTSERLQAKACDGYTNPSSWLRILLSKRETP